MKARTPPHHMEAEQSVLGGLMLDPNAWDLVCDILVADHFYKPAHQKIFYSIAELHKKNQPIDILTVSNNLLSAGVLEDIGGASYLAEILDATPSAVNIKSYAEIVQEKAILRDTISKCQNVIEEAYSTKYESIENFIDTVEARFFSLTDSKKTQGLVSAADIIAGSLKKIEELYEKKATITGVGTGFVDLDKATTGLQPGELVIVAARPSMGKTALGLNMAAHAALRGKRKVAFFSLEMGSQQIMLRLLASEARIDMQNIRVGKITDANWPQLINAASVISESHLFIDDTNGISPMEIRSKCRRLKSQYGLDMIMIDYLQMMSLKQKTESREREVSEISKMLKGIAKELQIPVVALAQLNRSAEGRKDRRPMLSDLRESGSIEQDADVIMMIYRDEYYDKENSESKGVAEIIIAKQRNGPVGTVKLAWVGQYSVFANLAHSGVAALPTPGAPEGGSGPSGAGGGHKPRPSGGSGGAIKNFAPIIAPPSRPS